MQDHWSTFCDYIEAVIHHALRWEYGIALGIFMVGSAIAFIKKGRNEGLRISARLFLFFYVVVLFCSTVFLRRTKRASIRNWYDPLWHYRHIGDGKVLLLPEVIMNVVVFVPIGFALGLAFRKLKGWQAVLVGMGISVGIELLQGFFRKGFADVDDVIHNTLGCAVGYLVYWVLRKGVKGELSGIENSVKS